MFAYCNNNPVNAMDPSGHVFVSVSVSFYDDPSLTMFFGGGGGGGGGYAFAGFSAAKDDIKKFEDFVTNESESTANQNLKEYGMAFYKGVPVFAVDAMGTSAFSFGLILIGSGNLNAPDFNDTLNHEYGHAVHFTQIGAVDYFFTTAIPSLICAGLASYNQAIDDHYYDLPWERVADHLGGVDRGYAQGADTLGSIFWMYTLLFSLASPC